MGFICSRGVRRFFADVMCGGMILLLSGCGLSGAAGTPVSFRPTPTSPPAPAQATPGAKLIEAAPLQGLDKPPERPLYVLNVTLDYANGMLNTQQRIEFKNPAGAPLNEIKFNVPPARRAGAIDITDARIFGSSAPLKFDLAETVLTVKLPQTLPANGAIALQFNYALKVPKQENSSGIGGDDTSRGAYSLTAGHWYILLAPWQNGNWYTPGYVPIGDSYASEIADFDVNVLAPDGITVAGAGDEFHEGRLWRYALKQARTFAFAASDNFKIQSSDVKGVKFYHYSYPQHAKFGEDVLLTAERAVDLYSRLWGAYPYKTFRIVETDRAQGQEYSGMVGIGSALYAGYKGSGSRHDLIATVAHETSHQWWFHMVGNDQIRTPWLDESFARYAELLFYENFYPNDVAWWKANAIGNARAAKTPIDLAVMDYANTSDYFVGVYQRGYLFLFDLRELMGKQPFADALRQYFTEQSSKITTPDTFFNTLTRYTQQDISPLVKQYFAGDVKLPCAISANAAGCRK
ncbi:MAG TPA: M1 family metallopeptidase [Thermoflexales bacterium]|nr:M1 family metallopeptidase [Thermoflexales bacterium]